MITVKIYYKGGSKIYIEDETEKEVLNTLREAIRGARLRDPTEPASPILEGRKEVKNIFIKAKNYYLEDEEGFRTVIKNILG